MRRLVVAAVCVLVGGSALAAGLMAPAGAAEPWTVTPVDVSGAGGPPNAVDVQSHYYKCRFNLLEAGAADSLVYKPLGHELRAENYYRNHLGMFRDWIRLADPDPIAGRTRNIGQLEVSTQSKMPARYRVVRQDRDELAIEFEMGSSTEGGQPWMEKIVRRRRIVFRRDSPAIRVASEIVNNDAEAHSVLFDAFNGLGLGRVETYTCMPGVEGKVGGIDPAEERASRFIFASELAGDWLGGVNEKGLGGAFSFDWADLDAMQVCMYKTVGAAYHAVMRRREVPAGKSITFHYTFMPFTGFGALDGMRDDLAGGVLVGKDADFKADVAVRELRGGASVPLRVFLASGRDRQVKVRLQCVRQEDRQAVLDQVQTAGLKTAATVALSAEVKLPADGLYVLTVAADDGAGTVLRMEKGLEVGKTRLVFAATRSAGEKRGTRDGGEMLGPGLPNPQFTTLDLAVVTPHLPAECNHVRGPVRAFFLTPADSTLGHVREIAERGDFTVDYCAVGKVTLPRGELNPRSLEEFRKKFRAGNPEVLVALGVDWSVGLKAQLSQELFARVREGMGVVLMGLGPEKQLELSSALADARPLPADAPLAAAAVDGPAIRRWELGKGRVVLLQQAVVPSRDEGRQALGRWTVLGSGRSAQTIAETPWRGFEYSYVRLVQLTRWAAGRESPLTITAAALEGDRVTATLDNAGLPADARLTVAVRTRRWEVRTSGAGELKIPSGKSEHAIKLGQTPEGGPLALELTLHDAPGKTLAFASAGAVGASPVEMKVLVPAGQRAGGAAEFTVEISGKAGQGRLRTTVVDRFGRLVFERSQGVKLAAGKTSLPLRIEGLQPLAVYHEIVADWYPNETPQRIAAEASADLLLLPADPPYADRFALGVAGAPERDALLIQAGLGKVAELGFTLYDHCYCDPWLYRTGGYKGAAVNVSVHERYPAGGAKKGGQLDSERLIMEPPLLPSDEAVAATKTAWQARARKEFEGGAFLLGLDDERRMSDDFDFHPQTLAGFRRWLAGRYADIRELNRTWGAEFADFAQVVPKRRKELGDAANLAPWLEFRMFIGDVLGEYYMRQPALWAAEIDPKISVCEWGIYEPSVAWPVDWAKYARCYKFTTRYGDQQGVLEELFRSFAPETRHGRWMGYGMMAISADRRLAPWETLLSGGNFCFFWEMRDPGSLNYAVLTSDQRATAGYDALARDEFPDLTGGIDRLVLAGRFLDDRIAIGYSYPSWLAQGDALGKAAKLVIEELGYQHRFVNLEDVPDGRLVKDAYKLLVLQQTSCLSRPQVEVIGAFVEKGGTLLCLGRCGWRDLHGAPYPEGSLLDALTGVDTGRASPLGRPLAVGDAGRPLSLTVERKGVALKGARALLEAALDDANLPVFTLRECGRGKVYWLNSALEGHRTVHRGGAADERSVALGGPEAIRRTHWQVCDEVVRAAAITPRCRFLKDGAAVFGQETWYYEMPSGRTLLVAHHLDKTEGPVHVTFDREGHVYELRTGRYFGRTGAIDDTFPEGCMRVYGILDYRVQRLKAAAERGAYKPGDTVRIACTVEADRGTPDLHALRIRVAGPDGQDLPAYRNVLVAPDGKAMALLPLALNQAPGKYTVTVTDAISGLKCQTQFSVAE